MSDEANSIVVAIETIETIEAVESIIIKILKIYYRPFRTKNFQFFAIYMCL
jgi:hypothetical protein